MNVGLDRVCQKDFGAKKVKMAERCECRQFNGIINKKCLAGINYRELVGGPNFGWVLRLPCNHNRIAGYPPDDEMVTCGRFQQKTAEEIALREQQMREEIDRYSGVFPLFQKIKREHQGKDWDGTVACPLCGGRLKIKHNSLNGHIWGRCETTGCLSWIE